MNKHFRFVLFFLYLFSCIVSISGQDLLASAEEQETAGNFDEAFSSYCSWLEQNREAERFDTVFNRAFDLPVRVGLQLDCLYTLLDTVTNSSPRYMLLKKTARIEEFLGRLAEAQHHYEEAAFLIPENRDFLSLFRSAFLLYELGYFERSFAQAKTIRSLCTDHELVYDTLILSGRILYAQNNRLEAKEVLYTLLDKKSLESATADQLYGIHQLAVTIGMYTEAESVFRTLKTVYPESIPTYMLFSPEDQNIITEYPPPATLLSVPLELSAEKERSITYTGVQTGSFLKKEHAEHMVRELKVKGFRAAITEKLIEGKRYYKVIVPVPENSDPQQIIIKLKENGYEGFLLFKN